MTVIRHARVLILGSGPTGCSATIYAARANRSGQTSHIALSGVFIAIGHSPNTTLFDGQFEMLNGYIVTRGRNHGQNTATTIPGVFAAGVLRIKSIDRP